MAGRKSIRKIKLAIALALSAAILGGCSQSQDGVIIMERAPEAESAGKTGLTFFGFKEGPLNVIAIENALHGFMGLYPDVNITYEGNEGAGY